MRRCVQTRITRSSHRQRHPELRSFLFQPAVEFFDHVACPLAVNLSRSVLPFPQHHVTPFVDEVRHFSICRNFFRELRRNKSEAFGISQRDIARHHRHVTDANRNVDSHQHGAFQRRRINATHVNLKALNLLDPGHIADGAIHNQSIVALGKNGCRKIVSRKGAIANFPEQIYDQNVAGLQNIYHPRVLASDPLFFLAIRLDDRIHIGTTWSEHRSNYPAHETPSWINHFPPRFELIAIARVLQNVPGLIRSNLFQTREHTVSDFRPAIREALPMPFRRKLDSLFLREKPELSKTRDGRQKYEHHKTEPSFFHVVCSLGSRMEFESLRKITHARYSN